MFNELTIQQLCALDYNRNMVVTAGPGAGKTRILSNRFCFILLTDDTVSLPQILTLTFTEKAAEEMKGRIYDMLIRLDRKLKVKGDTKLRNRIRSAKDQFDKNRISTIHSFCANLLKEHPVESVIDPHFKIVQGFRQKAILDKAIEDAMSAIWEENKDGLIPLLRSFGGKNNLFKAVRNLTENSSVFERVLETPDRLFNAKDWKQQVFTDYCGYIRDTLVVPYMEGLNNIEDKNETTEELNILFERWLPLSQKEDESYAVPNLFKGLRTLAETDGRARKRCNIDNGLRTLSYVDMVEEHFPDIFVDDNPDSIFEKELGFFINAVKVSIEKYTLEKEKINCLDFSDLETRSIAFLRDMLRGGDLASLKKIQNRYKYIMVDEFQDTNRIQWDIIRSLCLDTAKPSGNSLFPGKIFVVGDKRQAIYRFRGGDVTVFERVNKEIKDSNNDTVPLFWQSDSLSGRIKEIDEDFDPDTQKKRFESLSISEQKKIINGDIYLPHNFRSDAGPIAFFNRTFEEIFSNKHAGEIKNYETAPRDIFLPEDKKDAGARGSVTIYIPCSESGKGNQVEAEAVLITRLIESILGRHGTDCYEYSTYQDIRKKLENRERAIGILFYAFTHIKTYENMLREAGIPFVLHKGKGFYKSSEVTGMLQLLNYLTDERQEISLLGCLRGQIFGLNDPEIFDLFYDKKSPAEGLNNSGIPYIKKIKRQLESWRLLSTRLPITELIRTIISQRSLVASCSAQPGGEQCLQNMEKLIDIARRFQNEENGSLQEFVRYCLEMADRDEEEGEAVLASGENSAISLMTIHAAKGLEFPMVILPQLDRRFLHYPVPGRPLRLYMSERDESFDWNRQEGEIPVWPVEIQSFKYRKKPGPIAHLLMNRNRLEETAENRRVFYVGCTRTENHLVLIGADSAKKTKNEKTCLTSDDYREHANINQLLSDIYNMDEEGEGDCKSNNDKFSPVIKRCTVKENPFKGIEYDPEKPDRDSFGVYDEEIKKLDLTDPVKSNPYFQLSFTSVRIFLKCPVRFYYNSVLKLKEGEYSPEYMDEEYYEDNSITQEAEEDYDSKDALFIGNFVHKYLEKHKFGTCFDTTLFEYVKKRLNTSGCNIDICLDRAEKLLRETVNDRQLTSLLADKKGYAEIPFLTSALPGIEFGGVMDRIFKDPETGLWSIIDWKSNDLGEKVPDQVISANSYDIQLAFYKWALEKILNEKVDKQYIYFSNHGYLRECNWQGNPLDIFTGIASKITDFENSSEWLKNFGSLRDDNPECRFCGYNNSVCI
ncbi:MAG: UvrD-helicase domain-containing protein [Desulfobacteraceae bacterium]|jgi:ATP-dependent helicase/nuclease subunit A